MATQRKTIKAKKREKKLIVPLQREFLERILAYQLYAEEVDLELLEKVRTMIDMIDLSSVNAFEDRKILVEMITKSLEIILEMKIEDVGMLRNSLKEMGEDYEKTLEEMDQFYTDPENHKECFGDNIVDYIDARVSNITQYAAFYQHKDQINEIAEKLNSGDVIEIGGAANVFKNMAETAMNDISEHEYKNDARYDYIFGEDTYIRSLDGSIREANRPSSTLLSGIRELNAMLGGGFKSTRHYVFLGAPGTGKSVILENCLCWLSSFNKNFQTRDSSKKPIILYCTQENDLDETNERQYYAGLPSSVSLEKEFKDRTPDELYQLYLNNGWKIAFKRMYREDRSICTRELDNYCEKLLDKGYEVIAIIHDYIKRIRANNEIGDPYIDYGTIVNEEKAIATKRRIPFITVMQVNREAVRKVCEAQAKGRDIEKEVNPSFIGDSFPIYQNTDWCGMLVPQEDPVDGKTYMQIIQLKRRYRAPLCDTKYIAVPYEKDTIHLETNVGKTTTNVRKKWCGNLTEYNPASEEVSSRPRPKKRRMTMSESAE